jgi:hypothetical protein
LNGALTGPTLTTTRAVNSVSESFSISSQPGIAARSTCASLSAAHTRDRGAGIRNSPPISIREPSSRYATAPR